MVIDGEKQTLGIRRPSVLFHPTVKGIRESGDFSGVGFHYGETPLVAFVPGAKLSAVGQILAIGRIVGAFIGAGVGGQTFDGSARCRHGKQVAIGAAGQVRIVVGDVGDLRVVGRKAIRFRTA